MDIKCVVCGEPWDSYGVNHSTDMLPWEAKLFKAGAGCPCCKGERPEKPFEPATLSDIENGDEDPMLRIVAWENATSGKAPKWERPADPILWACEGCGVQVIKNQDSGELEYHLPPKAKGAQWYNSHPYYKGEPEAKPAFEFEGGPGNTKRPVCEFCLDHCDHCGKEVCSTLEYGDTYDHGNCAPHETWHVICMDCVGNQCSDCGGFYDDGSCDCAHCEDCGCTYDKELDTVCSNCGEEFNPEENDPKE